MRIFDFWGFPLLTLNPHPNFGSNICTPSKVILGLIFGYFLVYISYKMAIKGGAGVSLEKRGLSVNRGNYPILLVPTIELRFRD